MSDMPSAFSERERTARKEHKCCECVEVIPKGALYLYSSGVWDGRGNSYKTCLRCAAVREKAMRTLLRDFAEEGPAFTQLAEWLQDVFRLECRLKSEIINTGDKFLEPIPRPDEE